MTPSPSLAVALLALVIALSGTAYAVTALPKDSVTSKQIKKNAVKSAEVKNGSLRAEDLAAGTVPKGPGPLQAWRTLDLVGSWAAYGSSFPVPQYRKDQLGQVHLRGLVTKSPGSPVAGDTFAILPAGYRPAKRVHLPVGMGTPDGIGMVIVDPNGAVEWQAGPNGELDFTDLTAVRFWTD